MGENLEKIPHVALTIEEKDLQAGAVRILGRIRPEWDPQEVEFKMLTDGITNKLVGCLPKGAPIADTVLVRVYGNKTDLLIDRKAETRNILLLSSINLAPPLYATFDNGLAYGFVPGCTLNDVTVRSPDVYPLIATRMAKLHKVTIPDAPVEPFIWRKLESFLDLVPDVFSDPVKDRRYREIGPPKSRLAAELIRLRRSLSVVGSPVVFCHNDLLLGNVVYTEGSNSVTFIDYEYAAYNYQAFDIANHFLEFAGVEDVDYSKCPGRKFQEDWIRVYLREFAGEFGEDEVEKLVEQVEKFALVSHMFWAIWGLLQAEHSYIDFDFLGYACARFNEYFTKRDEVLAPELSQ